MTDSTTLAFAVMSALALLVGGLALWRTWRGTRVDPDEPITMAGGSFHIHSDPWDFSNGSSPTYSLKNASTGKCEKVRFFSDGDSPVETYEATGTFTITFTYERVGGGSGWKFHVLVLTYTAPADVNSNGVFSATLTSDVANANVDHLLKIFLQQGSHPHTKGFVRQIESTGLKKVGSTGGIKITKQLDDFYLETILS